MTEIFTIFDEAVFDDDVFDSLLTYYIKEITVLSEITRTLEASSAMSRTATVSSEMVRALTLSSTVHGSALHP